MESLMVGARQDVYNTTPSVLGIFVNERIKGLASGGKDLKSNSLGKGNRNFNQIHGDPNPALDNRAAWAGILSKLHD